MNTTAATAQHTDIRAQWRKENGLANVLLSSLAGTTFEWYDYFLYGSAAALVFPRLFFPGDDPFVALLLSMATYSVAFITRPLGAALFGHLGDRLGRRGTLIATMMLMGVGTTLIGLLPTYTTIGVAAPILLVILRFLQGVGLGGEWGGATLMVGEVSEDSKRGWLTALVQESSPLGLLLANGAFSIVTYSLSEEAFFSWGWRVPFLVSAVLVLIGLWLRVRVAESPLFEAAREKKPAFKYPFVEVFRNHKRAFILGVCSRIGSDVAFYAFNIMILVYGTSKLGQSRQLLLTAVLIGAVGEGLGILLWGRLSDKLGRVPVLITGAVCCGIWVFAFFPMMASPYALVIFTAAFVGNFFHSAMWAPLASFIPEIFPTTVRYTGAGFTFQTAGVFGGALAPIVATVLVGMTGSWIAFALYLIATLVLLIVAVLLIGETKQADFARV